jgi:hypothetical protein
LQKLLQVIPCKKRQRQGASKTFGSYKFGAYFSHMQALLLHSIKTTEEIWINIYILCFGKKDVM